MADFKNHRRFTLRCLDSSIIPVSLRLKSDIKTPKAMSVIKKTERALLNERVRTINNIEMLECQCHTCKTELSKVLDQETMVECNKLMFKIKEDRLYNTLEQQKANLDINQKRGAFKQGWSLKDHKHAKIHVSWRQHASEWY